MHRECKINMFMFLYSKLSGGEPLNSISNKIKGKIWQEHRAVSTLNIDLAPSSVD